MNACLNMSCFITRVAIYLEVKVSLVRVLIERVKSSFLKDGLEDLLKDHFWLFIAEMRYLLETIPEALLFKSIICPGLKYF